MLASLPFLLLSCLCMWGGRTLTRRARQGGRRKWSRRFFGWSLMVVGVVLMTLGVLLW